MQTYKMDVNTKVMLADGTKEYKLVGSVDVPVPTLSELGVAIQASGKDEQGMPTYSEPRIQWVFDAVLAAVKADARNKLEPGSTALKQGLSIASTVEEIIAKGERTGAALAIAREFVASFAKYLAEQSHKSAAVQAVLVSMVKNRATIPLSSEARKNALLNQLAAFTDQLVPEDASKFANILINLTDAAAKVVELEDSDFE